MSMIGEWSTHCLCLSALIVTPECRPVHSSAVSIIFYDVLALFLLCCSRCQLYRRSDCTELGRQPTLAQCCQPGTNTVTVSPTLTPGWKAESEWKKPAGCVYTHHHHHQQQHCNDSMGFVFRLISQIDQFYFNSGSGLSLLSLLSTKKDRNKEEA